MTTSIEQVYIDCGGRATIFPRISPMTTGTPLCGGQGLAARAEGRPLTYLLDAAHGGLLLTDRGFSPQYAPLLAGHI